MNAWVQKIKKFLAYDAWNAELSSLSGLRRLAVRVLRVARLIVRGFRDDDLPMHAAALTFSSLIALVPILAIALSILRGLGAGDTALENLHGTMASMPEQFQQFIDQMLEIVNRTNFWTIGWIGLIVLFLTIVQVLSSVEGTFNKVWGVETSRGLWRRFANYVSVTVVFPILIATAFALSATLSSETVLTKLGDLAWVYQALLKGVPFLSVAIAFYFLLIFVPNTSVKVRSALLGAVITALIWVSWQKAYISLQVGVSRYNAIYGTFASVPIFLAWLYICWVIILLGAEITFALQNYDTFHMERSASRANIRARIMLAMSVMREAAVSFVAGKPIFDAESFAHDHRVPVRLVHDSLRQLTRGNLLAEVAGTPGSYVLMRPPEQISARDIVALVTEDGDGPDTFGFDHLAPSIIEAMNALDAGLESALENTTLDRMVS